MKMTELRAENESLKEQIALLSEQKDSGKDNAEITQLKEKVRTLKKSIKDLKAEKVLQSGKIQTLENDNSSKEQDNQTLREDLERIQQQLTALTEVHTKIVNEVESLRIEQQALREKEAQLQIIQPELVRLRQVENNFVEKSAQVDALQAELVRQRQLLAEVQAEASKQAAEFQDQNVKLSNEMETVRTRLQSELESHREQSSAEISSLQAQKDGLSTRITDLTDKLKLVAKHLERQLSEKRKIASQYDTNVKEYQAFKVKSEKEVNDLMALLQKMAAELDASRSVHPTQPNLPSILSQDKPASQGAAFIEEKPVQQQLLELQNQISSLNEINAQQNRELTTLSKRMKHINHVLATPLGRLFSQLFGLNF